MTNTRQANAAFTPRIGEVYLMNFNGTGNEQSGLRPGVVFQNNIGNNHSPNIIALPITSSLKKGEQPTHVILKAAECGLKMDSMVVCENPEKMSKDRMGKYITTLSDEYMKQIATANLIATSAISFLNQDDLIKVWHRAIKLNNVA